ncbi:MAG: hypothetical protein JXA66_07905 [Oligoflexia bacterium]|nr:hypothetical protein [Oligoflexia bacterium]
MDGTLIPLIHINDELCNDKQLQKILVSIEQLVLKPAPLYHASLVFDEDRLLNFLDRIKKKNTHAYIAIGVFVPQDLLFAPAVDGGKRAINIDDNLILPSLASEDFRYVYRDFISRLLATVAPYKDVIKSIIPEIPYPYMPSFSRLLLDHGAIAMFSAFIHQRYPNVSAAKNMYTGFIETGRIPDSNFPPGIKRLAYMNDLNDFVYYYFNDFYHSVINVDNIFIHRPVIIPSVEMGYDISGISTGLGDISPDIRGISGGLFDFVKFTKTLASDNVAGGLFMKNGSVPRESRDEINIIIKSLNKKGDICFFIPPEYLVSADNELNFTGIFPGNVPSGYPDSAYFYSTWEDILNPVYGRPLFTYEPEALESFRHIFVISAEWMNPEWEKIIVEKCRRGGTVFITPCIPKYDHAGAVSGLIMEETLRAREIVFGDEWFVKVYTIGKGRLVLFLHDKIRKSGIPKLRELFKKVYDL